MDRSIDRQTDRYIFKWSFPTWWDNAPSTKRAIDILTKTPVPGRQEKPPFMFLVIRDQEIPAPKTIKTVIIVLGFLWEHKGKTLLLKTSHS